jgi:hypothetical protein
VITRLSMLRLALVVVVFPATCVHAASGNPHGDDAEFDGSFMRVPVIRVVAQPGLCNGPAVPVGKGSRYYACVEGNLKPLAPVDPGDGDLPAPDDPQPIT